MVFVIIPQLIEIHHKKGCVMLTIDSRFSVCNAAGHCKDLQEVERLAASAASAIIVGSITLLPRDGNPGNTFNGDPVFGLNSLGLPNPGIKKIREIGPQMARIAHEMGKPIIMSAAGLAPDEFDSLCFGAFQANFDGVELNVGCPNVADGGKRKPIFSYRRELLRESLKMVFSYGGGSVFGGAGFVSVKVSPMDPDRLDEIAEVIEQFDVDAVVTQNATPNCLDYRSDGKPLIDTPDKTGYAGGSGQQVFRYALGQVKQWRERLPKRIAVWGVGGVETGEHVRKMLWAGASVVQVGTAYFIGGPKVFGDIANQFVNQRED